MKRSRLSLIRVWPETGVRVIDMGVYHAQNGNAFILVKGMPSRGQYHFDGFQYFFSADDKRTRVQIFHAPPKAVTEGVAGNWPTMETISREIVVL